ncbi:MAG: protein kinase [Acidobacteriota bacterium]
MLDRVGRGGMGTVYRAIDETLHREVAIKVLNAELNDPEVARRFRAEAITVARLSHPGIATIYELFQHEGQWLMVMEFVRGETLERMVERLGALPADRAAELCMQSLAALAHAHSMGVVHRDLKPANIMITESGTVKIMDFGIARVSGSEHLTNAGFMMGTPAYMAPEQVLGQEIDARADVYAMGVVFYRLITAQLPFKGETPFAMAQAQVNAPPTPVRTIRADLPEWVEVVMTRSLAKKPDDRFPSAVAFHEGFARCLSGQPIPSDYASSAPTGLISTPPRAMPTGSLDRSTFGTASSPISGTSSTSGVNSSAPVPTDPSAMAPTMAGTPVSTMRPPTETLLASDLSSLPTMASHTPPATATAPVVPVAVPIPVAPVPPVAEASIPVTSQRPQRGQARRSSSMGLVAGAAAAVLVLGAAGGLWWRSRHAELPPEPPAVVEPAPEPLVPAATPAPPVTGATSTAPAPGASATTTAPPPLTAPKAAVPGTTTPDAGRSGTMPPATAATARNASASPGRGSVVEETPVEVREVKMLIVTGKKTKDDDVFVSFANGQVSVLHKERGTPLMAWPYKNLLHATYVKARDPRWDTSFASPPEGLDVGGVLRTSKNWFVLQNHDSYLVLRLSDANYARVIELVEARAGIRVSRPQADSDKN